MIVTDVFHSALHNSLSWNQFGIMIATDVFHSALYNSSSWKPVWWPGQGQCIYWLHINYEVSTYQGLCGMSGGPGLQLLSTQKSQWTVRHTQHQTISFSGVGEGSIFFRGEELCRIWGDSCVVLFQVGSVVFSLDYRAVECCGRRWAFTSIPHAGYVRFYSIPHSGCVP